MRNPFLRPKPLPDSFAKVYTEANRFYPQIDTALIFCTGAVAMNALLDRQLTRRDLSRLKATDDQVEEGMAAATKLHTSFKIPVPMTAKPAPDNRRTVHPERVRTLMSDGWRDGFNHVSAAYAGVTLDTVQLLPERHILHAFPNDAYPKAERHALRKLFEQDRAGGYKPQLVALGGLFNAGATLLAEKPARDAATSYRRNLGGLFEPGITRAIWDERAGEVQKLRPALRDILQEGLELALPEISDAAQYEVPPQAVTAMLERAISVRTILPTPPRAS